MDYEALRQFVKAHESDDLSRLLLSAARYPEVDVPFAVDQIKARRQLKEKLPEWHADDRLLFPSTIAAEQCSSERTARYKQRLVEAGWKVCDLTGGMGVDSYYLSRQAGRLTYIERYPAYCEAARHNFRCLDADNITVLAGDSADWLDKVGAVDAFYIDPARRGVGNKRVFALSDCEPDLPLLLPRLFQYAGRVIAKLSPMADIHRTLELLPETVEIHVLSVRNECKELLFVLERDARQVEPRVVCVNWRSDGSEESFAFSLAEERGASLPLLSAVERYLYEPNASILKAGAFKEVGVRFGLGKLHASSHLYSAEHFVADFPGRRFVVEEVLPFNGKTAKGLVSRVPRASITVRNFPLGVDELRKRTKIKDGGELYLFATTLADASKVLIIARKADTP